MYGVPEGFECDIFHIVARSGLLLYIHTTHISGADPGFPAGGGANLRFCHNFPQNCMKLQCCNLMQTQMHKQTLTLV